MKRSFVFVAICIAVLVFAGPYGCETVNVNTNNNTNNNGSGAGTYSLSPDDFADDTDLTNESPHVTLYTAGDDNQNFTLFEVTASEDGQGNAPTGTMVFGHAGIPFFNDVRRLKMEFEYYASNVTITFGGGTFSTPEIGRLEVYDADDNLLAQYVTQPLNAGESEVMSITQAGIAWAVAYIADGEGSFGRLDDLSYTVGGTLVPTTTSTAKSNP